MDRFWVGETVFHRRFGEGTVIRIDDYCHVAFLDDGQRIRVFDVSTPMLQPISRDAIGSTGEALTSEPPDRTDTPPEGEGRDIVSVLSGLLGRSWDARTAILEMRDGYSRNWRQTEWIGFYFEWLGLDLLYRAIGGAQGPLFGRVRFDYQRSYVWDLKAHPTQASGDVCIVNDVAAIRSCLRQRGYFGVAVLDGIASYDVDGSLKAWHDALKGGQSDYERRRVLRGAISRRRKAAFLPTRAYAVLFAGEGDLDRCIADGWVDDRFQAGMRNADGNARQAKITIRAALIPRDRIIS